MQPWWNRVELCSSGTCPLRCTTASMARGMLMWELKPRKYPSKTMPGCIHLLTKQAEMPLPCLSHVYKNYKNLAWGITLFFCQSMLSLQCRYAFTACLFFFFFPQQNQKFLFRGCKCSPQYCSSHQQLLQSHNVRFQDSPLSSPAILGHPLQH